MTNYKNLEVWKKSMEMVNQIYTLMKSYPNDELYALVSQTKRAAISVPCNIAEGLGRNHKKETVQFLHISRGSLYELETLLSIAMATDILPESKFNEINAILNTCMRILNGFIKYVEEAKLK